MQADNDWWAHQGYIVYNNNFVLVPPGSWIQDGTGASFYWTGTEFFPYNPPMAVFYDDLYVTLISQYPVAHSYLGRTVQVVMNFSTGPSVILYAGPEAALSTLQTFMRAWDMTLVTSITVTYTEGDCIYVSDGTIDTPLPVDFCKFTLEYAEIIGDAALLRQAWLGSFYPRSISGQPQVGYFYIRSDVGNYIGLLYPSEYGSPAIAVGDLVRITPNGSSWILDVIASLPVGAGIDNLDQRYVAGVQAGWSGSPIYTAENAGVYKTIAGGDVELFFIQYAIGNTGLGTGTIVATDVAAAAISTNYVVVEYELAGVWTLVGNFDDAALTTLVPIAYPDAATQIRTTVKFRGSCPFTCGGDGYVSFSLTGPGEVIVETTSGYYGLLFNETGTVYNSAESSFPTLAGDYCLYPCDIDGNKIGSFTTLYVDGATAANIDGLAGLTMGSVSLKNATFPTLNVPAITLDDFQIVGNPVIATLDISALTGLEILWTAGGTSLESLILPNAHLLTLANCFGCAFVQTNLDDNLANLRANSFLGICRFDTGTSSVPGAQGVIDRDFMNGLGATITTN